VVRPACPELLIDVSDRTRTATVHVRETVARVFRLVASVAVFVLSVLVPRDEDLWVFTAGVDGDRFADNAKYLFLHCADRDVRNVWIASNASTRDSLQARGHEAYLAGSLRGRLAMLRAGVFLETHGPVWPAYTGRARIVHLTHGNYLKRMLADHTRDWPRPVEVAVDVLVGRRRRFAVTATGRPAENTRSMHGVPERRLLVTGFPRNDVLRESIEGERIGLNKQALDEFVARADEGPVFLYAPTWREAYGEQNGIPLVDLNLGFDDLDAVLGEHDAHLYVSAHPASTFAVDERLDNVSVLDSGGDLYPFVRHADALVTDYSGIFYDYLLLDRPVLFFAPDLSAYTADRPLYFEYEEHVPGPIVRDAGEFVDAVEGVLAGNDGYADERAQVRATFYDHEEGSAAERTYRAVDGSLGR